MQKLLNALLILTSLIGYLEWGGGNSAHLFQVEADLLFMGRHASQFGHPFVLLPLFGQVLLLITLFQKQPRLWMTLTGTICLSVLLVFMLAIGLLAANWKMVGFALPFVILAVVVLVTARRRIRMRKTT